MTEPRSITPCAVGLVQRYGSQRSLREPHAGVDTLVISFDTMKTNDDAIENVFNPGELRWEGSADAESRAGAACQIRLAWWDATRIQRSPRGSPGWIHTGSNREVERDVVTCQSGGHIFAQLPVASNRIDQSKPGR